MNTMAKTTAGAHPSRVYVLTEYKYGETVVLDVYRSYDVAEQAKFAYIRKAYCWDASVPDDELDDLVGKKHRGFFDIIEFDVT